MEPRKPVPLNSTDRRRVHPIDELRARAWFQYVRENTGLSTNYALSKRFGGEAKKWGNYGKGGQPNDDVLNDVDQELPGSKRYYTSGPGTLKLWPALAVNDVEQLELITENSEEIDGEIARLKVEAKKREIAVDYSSGCIEGEYHPYDERLIVIHHQLNHILSEDLATLALNILSEAIKPYRDIADRSAREDFDDSISSARTNNAYTRKVIRAEDYFKLELGTIKNKGRRIKQK